jgi:hypothetical protein
MREMLSLQLLLLLVVGREEEEEEEEKEGGGSSNGRGSIQGKNRHDVRRYKKHNRTLDMHKKGAKTETEGRSGKNYISACNSSKTLTYSVTFPHYPKI